MTQFEAVLFDMDGTLVNSEPHWLAAEEELMAEYDHIWTHDDQQYCFGGPLSKVGRYMWELAGHRKTPDWFHQELVNRTLDRLRHGVEFMPGALELLRELKAAGIPTALVTASPDSIMHATLEGMGEKLFDYAVSADQVQTTKPNPEAYLLAARKLDVNIENCIVLEDSNTGVQAGLAAGAFVLAIPALAILQDYQDLTIIESLEGVTLAHLEQIFESQHELDAI